MIRRLAHWLACRRNPYEPGSADWLWWNEGYEDVTVSDIKAVAFAFSLMIYTVIVIASIYWWK